MAFEIGKTQTELKDNEIMVLIISSYKTKTGKTCVKYAFPKKVKTEYEKGYSVCMDAWFDTTDVFEKIKPEMFGTEVKAKYEYILRSNGSAYMSLLDICI